MIDAKKSSLDVLTVGSAMLDTTFLTDELVLIDHPSDPLRRKLIGMEFGAKLESENVLTSMGGGGCNTAVALRRLGLRAAALVCVGEDAVGRSVSAHLKDEGVVLDALQTHRSLRTGTSFVVGDQKHRDHLVFTTRGANAALILSSSSLRSLRPSWVVLAPLRCTRWRAILTLLRDEAKQGRIKIVFNPGTAQIKEGLRGLASILKVTECLVVNDDEARELLFSVPMYRKRFQAFKGEDEKKEFLIQTLAAAGPRLVVVTDGENGAHAGHRGGMVFQPARPVNVQDTTGAGDCFTATLTAMLVKGHSVKEALVAGMINTASLVQHVGAQAGLLTWKVLKSQL